MESEKDVAQVQAYLRLQSGWELQWPLEDERVPARPQAHLPIRL